MFSPRLVVRSEQHGWSLAADGIGSSSSSSSSSSSPGVAGGVLPHMRSRGAALRRSSTPTTADMRIS